MKKNTVNGVTYFTFESFEKHGLRHCFTTRLGGVSSGTRESLSFSHSLGDSEENVRRNFEIISKAVDFNPENITSSAQTHSTNLRHVTAKDRGKGYNLPKDYDNIDGLVTNEPDIVLTTFYADCVPLFFYDTKEKAIALSHSGWRGAMNMMGAVTIGKMRELFGSHQEDIICGIGPSIGFCCFEVEDDVMDEFSRKLPWFKEYTRPGNESGKHYIDLTGINREIMTRSGVPDKNIECARLCTKCRGDLFFSHRRDGKRRGNHAAFLTL